jgi:hypothetical protein
MRGVAGQADIFGAHGFSGAANLLRARSLRALMKARAFGMTPS